MDMSLKKRVQSVMMHREENKEEMAPKDATLSNNSRASDEKILCDAIRKRSATVCSGGSNETGIWRAELYCEVIGMQ